MFKKKNVSDDKLNINVKNKTGMITNNATQSEGTVSTFEPRTYAEVQFVADNLKANKSAIVKLERLSDSDSRRVTDFLSGVIYSIDGKVSKLDSKIYLFTPEAQNK